MENFGLLIKALRTREGFTQKTFAEKLNISHTTVSKWENHSNYPDITMLRLIANTLNVTCDELLNPTETLQKLNNSSTETETSDISLACTDISEQTEPDTAIKTPVQKKLCVSKRLLLLICIPILLCIISITIYFFTKSPYQFIEARNNVKTDYGPAYELIYCIDYKMENSKLIEHSKLLKDNWETGVYEDSTESTLIVSYYLTSSNLENGNDWYFRIFYFLDDTLE